MQAGSPKWRRRGEARPGEIVQAALEVFSEKGFAAAKLDEIAGRAGTSKGALYLYFETKEDIFRAVVRRSGGSQPRTWSRGCWPRRPCRSPTCCGLAVGRIVKVIGTTRLGAVAKLVIGESRNFPELARVWHDEVVSRALRRHDRRADEEPPGTRRDPRRRSAPRGLSASSGPVLMGVIWQETFTPWGVGPRPGGAGPAALRRPC
ncbi:TetR/AcrR family transcriptional regulator [Caulobacter segnis]